MTAVMIVLMDIDDPTWLPPYADAVPPLLEEYGARALAAGRSVEIIEGIRGTPDRVAVFEFPDLAALRQFMADPRYAPHRAAREAGARSEIMILDNEISGSRRFA